MISFSQIPSNIRTPFLFTEFDNTGAVSGPQKQPFKILVIGQKLSTGTKDNLSVTRVTSADQAKTFFGNGSMLHEMAIAVFKNNTFTEAFFAAIEDLAAGVKAVGSIKFSGSPTETGIAIFRVCGYKVSVSVTQGDTPAALATKLVTAIGSSVISVSSAVDGTDTAKVNITYNHKGLLGNQLDIRQGYYEDEKGLPSGLSTTIVQFASGAGNPDVTALLAALPQEHFNVLAFPYTDSSNLALLNSFLDERWGALKMIDGVAFSAANLAHAPLSALGESINTKNISIMDSHASMSGPHIWSAALAGVVAFEMSNDAARPLQTVKLNGVFAEESKDSFNQQERNMLLFDGISTHTRSANNEVLIERMITTYKTNAAGADDVSYLNVESLYQLSYIRYDWNNYIKRKYPRHKLASDGTRVEPGQVIVTPSIIKAEAIAKYDEWISIGMVEDMDAFKAGLIVERNASDVDRLDIEMTPDLMNQFRIGATKIKYIL